MTEQNEISKILFNRLISYKLRAIKAKVNVRNATFNLHEIKAKQKLTPYSQHGSTFELLP